MLDLKVPIMMKWVVSKLKLTKGVLEILDEPGCGEQDEAKDEAEPGSKIFQTPAFRRIQQRLNEINENNNLMKLSLSHDKEQSKFMIFCNMCKRSVSTTAKRGLIPLEEHLKTWSHLDRENEATKKSARKWFDEVEYQYPSVFLCQDTRFLCRDCGISISANAESRGNVLVRCNAHINSDAHKANAQKTLASKTKAIT